MSTGDMTTDAVIGVLATLLVFLGGFFGRPILTTLGNRLRGVPDVPEPGQKNSKPIDQASALRAGAEQVAGPGILGLLLPFVTALLPLILDLIERFRQANKRSPNPLEVQQIIQEAQRAAQQGRIYPILLDEDDPMPDRDLEKVASGKETIGRANRTLDSIDAAARNLGTAARSGDNLFQQGSRFLGS